MWLKIDRWFQSLKPKSVQRQASDVLRRKRLKELNIKITILKFMEDYGFETVYSVFEEIVDELLMQYRKEE